MTYTRLETHRWAATTLRLIRCKLSPWGLTMLLVLLLIILPVTGNILWVYEILPYTVANVNPWATFADVDSSPLPICRITINGAKDGLGHNLNSLLSLLNAHGRLSNSGKSKLYYDATFLTHTMYHHESTWTFEHLEVGSEENNISIAYYLEVQRLFAEYNGQSPRSYRAVNPALHWIADLDDEEPCKVDIVYQIGNAFFLTQERYHFLRDFFVDKNKHLPPSRLNPDLHSLVVHIRMNDGEYRYTVKQVVMVVGRLIRLLSARYLSTVEVYIHTDGFKKLIKDNLGPKLWVRKLFISGRNDANVLQVISDIAHCDTFVGTPASLSHLGSYLTKAKQVFGAGNPNFELMSPRTKDLHKYIEDICYDKFEKCNGDEFFLISDQWIWG